MENLIALAHDLARHDSRRGYLDYLRHVVVDSRPAPQRFASAARHWQWERASRLAPPLEALMGMRPEWGGPRYFWSTLARGHDKTTGLGRLANYALFASRRPLMLVAAAADRDQAALLTDAMRREAELNPWLGEKLAFRRDEVEGPGGLLRVLTSDAPTAAGLRADIVICDEIVHWQRRDLWDMLWSGLHKRAGAMCVVITNAGVKRSWQWDIKEAARGSAAWEVYEAEGRLDTWMSEADVAEARRLLLPSEARRLLDNRWIDPAEESGFLAPADIEACEALWGELGLGAASAQGRGAAGVEYWAGIDYGPKRDRTALSVLHQRPSGLMVVSRLDVWQGRPEAPVQIADIRAWVRAAREDYPGLSLIVDPYQLDELCQDLGRSMRVERFEARGGKANYEMAEALRSLVVNRSITWPPNCALLHTNGQNETFKDELLSLVTRKMSYGYRIDHEATKHDDRAVAVGMAAWRLLQAGLPQRFNPPKIELPETRLAHNYSGRRAEGRGLYGMR